MGIETITFGGGCFWCIDSAFRKLKGVQSVKSGYCGGKTDNPTYKDICTGQTGHAEVVQIEFDTEEIDLEIILRAFFTLHDPTTLNKQGADVGTQYRSAIFYRNNLQKNIAEQVVNELNNTGIWADPVVTELSPFDEFYDAESYHQDYFSENASQRYCQLVIQPKLKKFMANHAALLH